MTDPLRFTKGHGTENDFVLVPDLDGARGLSVQEVVALADRRAGIGGDGVIRVVRTVHAQEPSVQALAGEATWFMDYRNADGSLAQMCGNGTRVFAAYLLREGLEQGERFTIATRAGAKEVVVATDADGRTTYAVELGPWRLTEPTLAQEEGFDALVHVGEGDPLSALSVDMGNPHTVAALPPEIELDSLDLTREPAVNPLPEEGTNVELVRPLGPGHLAMRVHERGVGETRSCGTGACAAAVATAFWAGGLDEPSTWLVDVPGGRLEVRLGEQGSVQLVGPAELVADGVVHGLTATGG